MLDVSSIDLHYGAAQALRGISLKAEPGKVTCVLGRNGVGKTSLLRAIVGQHPISAGAIRLADSDISKLRTADRARRGVAIVPQGRCPTTCSRCFRSCATCSSAAAATSRAGSSSSSPSAARW
jgi:ABC-type branched-subunit amino acid transport system ATPase component